jgi:hypothetical protein
LWLAVPSSIVGASTNRSPTLRRRRPRQADEPAERADRRSRSCRVPPGKLPRSLA